MNADNFLHPSHWYQVKGGPRYIQLRNRLMDGIYDGIFTPNTPLPPEREIAHISDFSRVTVRKAIQMLVDEGIIIQKQGSGSFVSQQKQPIDQDLSQLTSFSEDMSTHGKTTSSKWLEKGVFLPTPREREALNIALDASVSRIARLRLADSTPMAIERASLPIDILPNPLIVETSLYAVLEENGNRPVKAKQSFSAVNLSNAEARLLDLKPGDAALRIERISYLENGRVGEFTQSLYRGDAYKFITELILPKGK